VVVVAAVPSFPDQLDWWEGHCEMGTANEMRLEKEEDGGLKELLLAHLVGSYRVY